MSYSKVSPQFAGRVLSCVKENPADPQLLDFQEVLQQIDFQPGMIGSLDYELLKQVEELQQQVATLKAENKRLQNENERLRNSAHLDRDVLADAYKAVRMHQSLERENLNLLNKIRDIHELSRLRRQR